MLQNHFSVGMSAPALTYSTQTQVERKITQGRESFSFSNIPGISTGLQILHVLPDSCSRWLSIRKAKQPMSSKLITIYNLKSYHYCANHG